MYLNLLFKTAVIYFYTELKSDCVVVANLDVQSAQKSNIRIIQIILQCKFQILSLETQSTNQIALLVVLAMLISGFAPNN